MAVVEPLIESPKKKKKLLSFLAKLGIFHKGQADVDPELVDDTIDWWSKYFASKGEVKAGQVSLLCRSASPSPLPTVHH